MGNPVLNPVRRSVNPYTGTEEKALLIRLKSGDVKAFEAIYHQYKNRLAGKFLQLLKSDGLAQDALQDLFSKIWEIRETIDPDQSFPAFIYRIATNLAHNTFRRATRDVNLKDKLKIGYSETYTHIEEDLITKEGVKIVQEAMNQLPERQRQVFIMHKIEGKSYKEISEELNISPSAINNHITRANKHLSEILGPKTWFIAMMLSTTGLDLIDFINH